MKSGPFTIFALEPDTAVLLLYEAIGDVKTQSCAGSVADVGILGAEEFGERPASVRRPECPDPYLVVHMNQFDLR